MPCIHALGKLKERDLFHLSMPGRYGDGNGLYLKVGTTGSKSWIQRITFRGRRLDLGLGGFPAVNLEMARERAFANKRRVALGLKPLTGRYLPVKDPTLVSNIPAPSIARSRMLSLLTPTFRDAAIIVHGLNAPTWKNRKHSDAWLKTLETYAFPVIGDMPLDSVRRRDVLNVLLPIWTTKAETARRVRQRMSKIFRWGMCNEYNELNPAGEEISEALPSLSRNREHQRALDYGDCSAAIKAVEATSADRITKLCFYLIVLTACRNGEARFSRWDEVNLQAGVWTVPAERMKMNREHRIPLSDKALSAFQSALELRESSELVFPSSINSDSAISGNTLNKLFKSAILECGDTLHSRTTVHGFRTAFRVWAEECTSASHAAKELSLAHQVGNEVERAYLRTDLLEQRRELMQAWADFLYPNP